MEKRIVNILAAAAMAVLLVAAGSAEGMCMMRNESRQPLVIVPTVQAAGTVTVDVGATVVLQGPQQHCYFRNPKTGHQSGPVILATGRVYAIVDADVEGQVNVCLASFLAGILHLGAIISAGI